MPQHIRRTPWQLALLCSCILLQGCLTQSPTTAPDATQQTAPKPKPESRVKTSTYPDSEIHVERLPLPDGSDAATSPPVVIPPSPKKMPQPKLKDGHGIPAYQTAMNNYLQNLRSNNLAAAEANLLQAQRIAPQSAAVYRELARLANLKQQAPRAEAFARKGLTLAQNQVERKLLWKQILQSAQLMKNPALIQEAQRQISAN